MGDKSDKHGPRLADEMRHETEGLRRAGRPTHAEEWTDPEPVETDDDRNPTSALRSRTEGTPPGMSPRDVEERSELARSLTGVRYPARRDELIDHVRTGAPDSIVAALERLPDRSYESLAEVAEELGHGRETRRF